VLGGETVYVSKLTPFAVGTLQAFFKAVLTSPYEAARDAIADLPDDEARAAWVEAVQAARGTWPPELHSEIGGTLVGSPEGRGVLVWAATQRHTPGMTRTKADEIGRTMTDAEFLSLYAAIAPGEIGDLRNPDSGGDAVPYSEIRAKLCEKYPGWTFETVDNMTFEAIESAWHDGKPTRGITIDDPSQATDMAKRWREFYVGL
jgi:hypothetical protein